MLLLPLKRELNLRNVITGCFLLTSSLAFGQTYPTWDEIPYVTTASPNTFKTLFQSGYTQTIRAVMIGDSQETTPGGLGDVYVPRFNYELFKRYGNAPETPLTGVYASDGGGQPWSDWLVRHSLAGPGPLSSRVSTTDLPPYVAAASCSLTNGNNIANNEWYGCLTTLQADAYDTNPNANLNLGYNYFDKNQTVYFDIYSATNISSGEIVCKIMSVPTHAPSYYGTFIQSVTLNQGLESPIFDFKKSRVTLPQISGYPCIELYGSDPNKLTDIIAVQFISSNPIGCTVTSWSQGGYRCIDYYGGHPGADRLVSLFNPSVIMINYGANDGGQGFTPQQFYNNMYTLITTLRSHIGQVPIILFGDPYRFNSPYESNLNQYAGVEQSLSYDLPDVCFVNSRRLTDRVGWNASNYALFLSDVVHYTPYGAITKAKFEISALFSFLQIGCVADIDNGSGNGIKDGAIDINDLLYFLNKFASGNLDADIEDADGSGLPDNGVDINDLLRFLSAFQNGC